MKSHPSQPPCPPPPDSFPSMDFPQAEQYLDRLQMFTIKLGLATTRDLLAELGNPQERLAILHIAGTNGKGSVGATLQAALTAAGHLAGFYSSPHLSSVRERYRLGDQYISEATFARLVSRLAHQFTGRQPTYFEFATLLALLWFAEEQTEVVILETGMGGRLDATNVVTPLVSIITDIGRDHEQYLGDAIEAIAGEKAGIIKPGIPVICSGREPAALPVIRECCRALASPLYVFGEHFSGQLNDQGRLDYQPINGPKRCGLSLSLIGAHQAINASLALAALDLVADRFPVSEQALRQGLARVSWPGRMELIPATLTGRPCPILLDGAHNEAGIRALSEALLYHFPQQRLILIWGNMADKHLGLAFHDLLALADHLILTRTESPRFAEPADLLARLPPDCRDRAQCAAGIEQALDLAASLAGSADLICIAGSLYLVGRARQVLLGEVAR